MRKSYYSENRERILAQQREYRRRNKDRVRMGVRCSTYGISRGDVDRMLKRQKGNCPVCGKSLGQRFDIDHCHKTNQVRGLLHHKCNVGLGYLKDSPAVLRRAIRYLERRTP